MASSSLNLSSAKYAGLVNGLLAGLITVAVFLLAYWIGREQALHPALWWGSLLIYLYFMYRAGSAATRRDLRAYLQPAFLVFVIANLLFYGFYFYLITGLDPGLLDVQAAQMEAQGRLESRDAIIPTPASMFLSYCYSLFGGFLLALAVAAVRSRP